MKEIYTERVSKIGILTQSEQRQKSIFESRSVYIQGNNMRRYLLQSLILCTLFAFHTPSSLFADCCVFQSEEDCRRTQVATVVAGATVVALVGGVAYAAFGSSGHHHSSYSSYCYDSYSYCPCSYSSYDSSYSDSYDCNSHRYYHSGHYYSSNPYSIFSNDDASSFSGGSGEVIINPNREPIGGGEMPNCGCRDHGCRRSKALEKTKNSSQLSGTFTAYPSSSQGSKGSITAFVQLPDGTTEMLGNLPFSQSGSSSLPYGPFTQKGTYAFGIRVDEGSSLATQARIAAVEVQINGSTVQRDEFSLPPHAPAHYTPALSYTELR